MQLRDWQLRFLEGMRAGGAVDGLFQPADGPDKRFFVYSNGHWLRVSESLLEDFPLAARVLGRAIFSRRVREFLAAGPRPYELELSEVSSSFAAWLRGGAGLERAVRLDLLAVEARLAPRFQLGLGFGLSPSARFLEEGHRRYCIWRDEDGVCRERITARDLRLLACFREPAPVDALGKRLEALGEDPAFVQGAVGLWSSLGVIVSLQ